MWQILGNLYKKDTDISRDYKDIKELIRKALLKEPQKQSIIGIINLLRDSKGYKDCNLHTVLKAIEEIQKEETTDDKWLNVNINDIVITIDTLPF